MKLTPAQIEAVESEASQIVVLAGAGSGKTQVLIQRMIRLITLSHARPRSMVAITFTNAAADEVKKRLNDHRSGLGDELGYVGTVHGFLLKLLRAHFELVGIGSALAVIDEQGREDLIKERMESLCYRGTRKNLDRAIAMGPTKNFAIHTPGAEEIVARSYFAQMIEACSLDFDMILHYGAEAIHKLGGIVKLNGVEVTHLFVDEMQDSGDLEFSFYSGSKIPFKFFVGDTDQAIYSFRGGKVAHILDLVRRPETKVITLEDNFRCGAEICTFANTLIGKNQNRFPKQTLSKTPHVGEVELWLDMPEDTFEARTIAQDIAKTNPPTCAVLARTNPVVNALAKMLEGYGVKVAKNEFARRPTDWRAVKDCVNMLVNPDNDSLAFRVLAHSIGRPAAEKQRSAALHEYRTINDRFNLAPYDIDLAGVTTWLAQQAIGIESREMITAMIEALEPHSTIADLAFAVARDEQTRSTKSEGVVVTTIHAAKGREWHTVYLPAFEQGVIPIPSGELEEERRIAYVGFTRGAHRLVISQALKRKQEFGPALLSPRSKFLIEVQHLCESV